MFGSVILTEEMEQNRIYPIVEMQYSRIAKHTLTLGTARREMPATSSDGLTDKFSRGRQKLP